MATMCTESWTSNTGKGLKNVGVGLGVIGSVSGLLTAININATVPPEQHVNEVGYIASGFFSGFMGMFIVGSLMDMYGKECR